MTDHSTEAEFVRAVHLGVAARLHDSGIEAHVVSAADDCCADCGGDLDGSDRCLTCDREAGGRHDTPDRDSTG